MDVTGGGLKALKAPPEVCVKPGLQECGKMMPKLPSQHTAGGAGPRPAQTGPSRHGHLAPWLEEAAQAVLPKAPRSPGQSGLSGSSASSSGVWFLFPKSRKSLRYTGRET